MRQAHSPNENIGWETARTDQRGQIFERDGTDGSALGDVVPFRHHFGHRRGECSRPLNTGPETDNEPAVNGIGRDGWHGLRRLPDRRAELHDLGKSGKKVLADLVRGVATLVLTLAIWAPGIWLYNL